MHLRPKNSLPTLRTSIILLASSACIMWPAASQAGGTGQAPSSGIEAQAEFEIAKRQKLAEEFAPKPCNAVRRH